MSTRLYERNTIGVGLPRVQCLRHEGLSYSLGVHFLSSVNLTGHHMCKVKIPIEIDRESDPFQCEIVVGLRHRHLSPVERQLVDQPIDRRSDRSAVRPKRRQTDAECVWELGEGGIGILRFFEGFHCLRYEALIARKSPLELSGLS